MKHKYKKGEKAYMRVPVVVKAVDKDSATLEAIFSTQDEDRHGDRVLQEGWDLKNFKKNPVILNSHNYDDAAEVIGRVMPGTLKIEGKKLIGKIKFAVDENPKAKVIFDLYAGGFLSAFSVGFLVKEFDQDNKGNTDYFTIAEAELLEVSAVSVPANARALAKQKGIEIDKLDKNAPTPSDGGNDNAPTPSDGGLDNAPSEGKSVDIECPKCKTKVGSCDESVKAMLGDTTCEKCKDITENQPAPETPKKKSRNARVMKAIHSIESRRSRQIKNAYSIIKKLLEDDEEGQQINRENRDKVRKRRVNRAIRALIKSK